VLKADHALKATLTKILTRSGMMPAPALAGTGRNIALKIQ
jgi:hypothetical protein